MDDKELEVKEGTTLLQAALANKIDIPYFCYHPKLTIAGNCRMCLVNVKGQNKPVISCRERVREGMEVDTKSPEVKKMQQGVLEFILVNHPLDCPICDQSGECDLQDNYFKFSNFPSRLEDQKIHKPKAKPLGPLVTLDDERCILCTRCVRFCDEVAGTHELCITERGGHSELTTYPGKELKNPYSLCTVDVCPVGALTSTDFRFQKRVWFLKTTPSICTGCATGCNIKMDWDDGQVYRYRPRENNEINQCWMCDEGRLSYKFINENRLLEPMMKKNGEFVAISWKEAMKEMIDILGNTPVASNVVGVLSTQASCEENEALKKFLETLFPKAVFFATRKEVKNPSQDKFLIDADKNPNSSFLTSLGVGPLGEGPLAKGAIYMVLDNLTEDQRKHLIDSGPKKVILFTSNFGDVSQKRGTSPGTSPLWADLVLPKPTFAEQEGTFINRQNIKQKAKKAFDPKGHSKEIKKVFEELWTTLSPR